MGLLTLRVSALAADEVVLWNKLGSVYEVTHSEIGPNGTIMGGNYAFESAKYGNGYVRKVAGNSNHVVFPTSVYNGLKRRGALALWINPKVSQPIPYQYGVFDLAAGPFHLIWGDGITGRGIQGGLDLGNSIWTPMEPVQFVTTPGTPFHVALSWDIDGIDGTTDTVRAYRNGILTGKATGTWNPNAIVSEGLILGHSPDGGGYDKFITDNIVVWNYAKTDFSDRFNRVVSEAISFKIR